MENNNIFDNIDDALAEAPSGRAWQRLENRLEQRVSERKIDRERLRTQWTRQMIFSTAAVACLLFAAIITIFNILPKNDAVGKRAIAYSPAKTNVNSDGQLIIVENNTENDNAVKSAKTKGSTTVTTVNSGFVSNNAQTEKANGDIILPPQSTVKNEKPVVSAPNYAANTYVWSQDKTKKSVAKAAEPAKVLADNNYKANVKTDAKPEINADYVALDDNVKAERAMAAVDAAAVVPNVTAAKAPSVTAAKAPSVTAAKAPVSIKNTTKKIADKPAKKAVQAASINDLYWIIGNWHNETDTRTPYEAWTSEGKYELQGRGYFVRAKADTSRLETFKIKQEGNTLALYLPVDITGSVYRYELEAYDAYQWTFENEEMSFPQQIVLHRLSKDNFVFTMQNTDSAKVQNTKMRFQDPRISPLGDHTERTMKRVK